MPSSRQFKPLALGGVLDESKSPALVGATGGLTAATNLIYRRIGGWAKRPGFQPAYTLPASANGSNPTSAFRWHRGVYNLVAGSTAPAVTFTQTIVASGGTIYAGANPSTSAPPQLAPIFQGTAQTQTPPFFAPTRDPIESSVAGHIASDVLIVTGVTHPTGSFSSAMLNFTTVGGSGALAGSTMSVTISPPSGVNASSVTISYTLSATDTFASAVTALVAAINASGAVVLNKQSLTNVQPFLSMVSAALGVGGVGAGLTFTALDSGAGGNSMTVSASATQAITTPNGAQQNLTGGGQPFYGPLKYDGSAVTPLSPQIARAFTGCVTWHSHVWFWGDPSSPDVVFASDIDNPEGFQFMLSEGGYEIQAGDGDPGVMACVPIGDTLYVFKRNSITAIRGYDFQSGEYQFSVTPVALGYGIPSSTCVARLRNALVFWTGAKFVRLALGSFDPEHIGTTIPLTSGRIAQGDPTLMRCAAGDFAYATLLDNSYEGPSTGSALLRNVAVFACDVGNGVADTLVVYDDDASTAPAYAWSTWTGQPAAAFLTFSTGQATVSPAGVTMASDVPSLFVIPPSRATINLFGGNATSDAGMSISFLARTGWLTIDDPMLTKDLHRIFLDLEAVSGVTIAVDVLARGSALLPNLSQQPSRLTAFQATLAPAGGEAFQETVAPVNPWLRGNAFQLTFTEASIVAAFEILGGTADYILNPATP